MKYLWQLAEWPKFHWDKARLAESLAEARHRQGLLLGQMRALGFKLREEASLETLTADVVKTSEIEGERLSAAQVRSSIARRLGVDIGGLVHSDRNVEGIVEVALDATRNFDAPLTIERLFDWHASLFPTGRSGMKRISVAGWRRDATGPMEVVSGPMGKEKVHFVAPPAKRLDQEVKAFLNWFEGNNTIDAVLKAGVAHLWFVTIHPFDDGNGRIARAIADMALARSEQNSQRFYSVSSQIGIERDSYYDILERTQKNSLDITRWLLWFLACFSGAISNAQQTLESVMSKARFWEKHASQPLNQRQIKLLNKLLDGFEGKLTTGKWANIAKCSQDTAYRDILDLVDRGVLKRNNSRGRSTSYSLAEV